MEICGRKSRGAHLTLDLKLSVPMPDLEGPYILARARELLMELKG